jgi:hypothetical protein
VLHLGIISAAYVMIIEFKLPASFFWQCSHSSLVRSSPLLAFGA